MLYMKKNIDLGCIFAYITITACGIQTIFAILLYIRQNKVSSERNKCYEFVLLTISSLQILLSIGMIYLTENGYCIATDDDGNCTEYLDTYLSIIALPIISAICAMGLSTPYNPEHNFTNHDRVILLWRALLVLMGILKNVSFILYVFLVFFDFETYMLKSFVYTTSSLSVVLTMYSVVRCWMETIMNKKFLIRYIIMFITVAAQLAFFGLVLFITITDVDCSYTNSYGIYFPCTEHYRNVMGAMIFVVLMQLVMLIPPAIIINDVREMWINYFLILFIGGFPIDAIIIDQKRREAMRISRESTLCSHESTEPGVSVTDGCHSVISGSTERREHVSSGFIDFFVSNPGPSTSFFDTVSSCPPSYQEAINPGKK